MINLNAGGRYFLSSFHEKDGGWVRLIGYKPGGHVVVEMLKPVGCVSAHYTPGRRSCAHPSNLYNSRHDASHAHKYRHHDWCERKCDCR